MTVIEVIFAFKRKCVGKGGHSVTSDGSRLFSYSTCIAEWTDDNCVVFNTTKYSLTTAKHQNYLKNALETSGIDIRYLRCRVPKGTTSLTQYLGKDDS